MLQSLLIVQNTFMPARRREASELFFAAYEFAVGEVTETGRKLWAIISRPTNFSKRNISPTARGLFKALGFYSKIFPIAFLLQWLGSYYQFFQGASEPRHLLFLFIQIAIGSAVIAVFALAFGYKSRLSEILQAVLYADAAFVLVLAAISLPLVFVDAFIHIPEFRKEIDVFATEHEVCVASASWLYWILRGELQFEIFNDLWKPNDWARWALANRHYFLVPFFLVLFAKMVRARMALSFPAIIIVSALAYTIAVESSEWGIKKTYHAIARASGCDEKSLLTVLEKYSPSRIAKQVEYKLNNRLRATLGRQGQFVHLHDNSFFVFGRFPPGEPANVKQAQLEMDLAFEEQYCSNDAFWRSLRAIKYPLIVVFEKSDGTLIFAKQYEEQKDCLGVRM